MIKVDGIEIKMEGSFGELINEASRIMHAVAKAASDKFGEETDGEVSYDHIVELMLEDLSKLKKFDTGDKVDLPNEIMDSFNAQLQEEQEFHKDNPSFVDFDTSRPSATAGKDIIQSVIKGVYNDPRSSDLIDIDDLKAIKKNRDRDQGEDQED